MKKLLFFFVFISNVLLAQTKVLTNELNKILVAFPEKGFNGIVVIQQGSQIIYRKVQGYSNLESKKKLKWKDRFVIGSISKQFAGAMVLRAIDEEKINPNLSIRNYLPELIQKWADTVTVHHLMTHLHGIRNLNQPTAFPAGTQYEYSQIGFELLSKILEKTYGRSFADLSADLFLKCGLNRTSHPHGDSSKVNGYNLVNGVLEYETQSLKNYVAAGAFISNAEDLLKWNKVFYSGKLFSKKGMELLTTQHPVSIRNHPLFGETKYGYGITVDTKDGILQYGQTGFAPGFVSMNFYYPEKDLSLIILSNVVWDENDLNKAFRFHMSIWQETRKYVKQK